VCSARRVEQHRFVERALVGATRDISFVRLLSVELYSGVAHAPKDRQRRASLLQSSSPSYQKKRDPHAVYAVRIFKSTPADPTATPVSSKKQGSLDIICLLRTIVGQREVENSDRPHEEVALKCRGMRLQYERQLVQRRQPKPALQKSDKRAERDELDRRVDQNARHRLLQFVTGHRRRVRVVSGDRQVEENRQVQRIQHRDHELDVLGQEDVLGVEKPLELVVYEFLA
jgi:hypothetical protein